MLKPLVLPSDGTPTDFPGARLRYFDSFFTEKEAEAHFNQLLNETPWQQDPITVFGKTYAQPRLTALYANNSLPYSYSGITMHPHQMTPLLSQIQERIHQVCDTQFTTVLLNHYRDGKDSNGWHADNEKELGNNPVIASVSLGETRPFHFKHRHIKEQRHKLNLEHGSLLIMKGEMQSFWLHQIAKTKKKINPRINLTFRKLVRL